MVLISATEAGKRLGLSSRTIRRYISDGKIEGYNTGGKYLVSEESLLTFLENTKIQVEKGENENDEQ